jgi:asparagine synthase (glutamine-hydrolysing)
VPRFSASLGDDARCALGLLTELRQGHAGGPWTRRDRSGRALEAVGEVTLYERRAPDRPDGETLLDLYAREGEAAFLTRGMFAVAVWDGETLTLARDALGARTLFYARDARGWSAASTLRAFTRRPGARLDLAGVRDFLTFAYLPGERTLVEGVREVPPGCVVRLGPGDRRETVGYWEPAEAVEAPPARPGRYARRLRTLVEEATAARLPRGEDVGVFLSGGLDSSLVTALAARLHDRTVRTYAISFGEDLPNELAYSGLVAAHCRTRHRVLTFTGQEVAEHLPEAIAELDCLVGDPLTVPNLLLARAAAGDGLRVVLNGEGGDPVFGGPKNLPMILWELERRDPDPAARARAYLVSYRKCYEDLPQLFTPEALDVLRDAPPAEAAVAPYLESPRMRSVLNRLLYTNVRTKGAHHILTKVERLTSSCGLEGRAPLFDRAVVDFAFAVPPTLKLAGASEKRVLKLAAAGLLPRTVVHRPKSGMRVPVQHWLRGPLGAMAEDLLVGPRARARGLFRPEPVRAWMRGEGSLWPRHGAKLWLLLSLELWIRSFLDE